MVIWLCGVCSKRLFTLCVRYKFRYGSVNCFTKKTEMQTERSLPCAKLIHLQTAAFSARPLALTPITGKFAFPCTFQQIPVHFPTLSSQTIHLFPFTHLSCLPWPNSKLGNYRSVIVFIFWANYPNFFFCVHSFAEVAAKRCDFHNVHYKDVIKSRLDAHTLLRRGRWDGLMKKVAER